MTALRIMIAGREYEVACDDGQENHLKSLARALDHRIRTLTATIGRTTESQALMLAALMLTDELQEADQERTMLRSDIHHSSHSFETSKQIELENAVAATINDIANRIEAIAGELEKV